MGTINFDNLLLVAYRASPGRRQHLVCIRLSRWGCGPASRSAPLCLKLSVYVPMMSAHVCAGRWDYLHMPMRFSAPDLFPVWTWSHSTIA